MSHASPALAGSESRTSESVARAPNPRVPTPPAHRLCADIDRRERSAITPSSEALSRTPWRCAIYGADPPTDAGRTAGAESLAGHLAPAVPQASAGRVQSSPGCGSGSTFPITRTKSTARSHPRPAASNPGQSLKATRESPATPASRRPPWPASRSRCCRQSRRRQRARRGAPPPGGEAIAPGSGQVRRATSA